MTVDVLGYNSKRYYVITDGSGSGEQVHAFPISGSETVLDALANIHGLPAEVAKRSVRVHRKGKPGMPDTVLPVDWAAITQRGETATNYQLRPGDRLYVTAQK